MLSLRLGAMGQLSLYCHSLKTLRVPNSDLAGRMLGSSICHTERVEPILFSSQLA